MKHEKLRALSLFDIIFSFVWSGAMLIVIPYFIWRFDVDYDLYFIIFLGILLIMDVYLLAMVNKVILISEDGILIKQIFSRSKNISWENIVIINYNYKVKRSTSLIRLRSWIAVCTKKKATQKSKDDFKVALMINRNEKNINIIKEYEEKYLHEKKRKNNG